MAEKFRGQHPKRTFNTSYSDYKRYKAALAKDFFNRCGYTNCSDMWFGGKVCFHIDHFKSHSKHPNLKTQYSNLVYACSYVNILKNDDNHENYLDPCDIDYNDHFYRDEQGNIHPKSTSPQANYMFQKLKLYLKRYQVIWMLDNLVQKMEELRSAIESTTDKKLKKELLKSKDELSNLLLDYLKYLKATQ